ncbi:unnamed protein product [Chrysoparadoxa australica]
MRWEKVPLVSTMSKQHRSRDQLTGADITTAQRPAYTEQPLGRNPMARSRVASYDSAVPAPHSKRVSDRVRLASWEFPGWGSHFRMDMPVKALMDHQRKPSHSKLGEWSATAISGNDILSSVLYVSGLVATSAGWLSPVCLLIVAGILYLYRHIYGEAISALPMNGGSYNVLLNSTSKGVASIGAVLAVISYTATGVVSAATAIEYLKNVLPSSVEINPLLCTCALLLFFAILMFWGIQESAGLALCIFILHTTTLTLLCIASAAYAVCNPGTFHTNLHTPLPDVMIAGTLVTGNWATALLVGTSTAMLGVSGFESSSQFVEEQAPGVFVKTLRNMWIGVAVFNPVICLMSFCVLQMDEIIEHKHSMLALLAHRVGYWWSDKLGFLDIGGVNLGQAFELLVSVDAFIVLAGSTLTAYVGITGLIRRMAMDRLCLPQSLLHTNSWRGTNHTIIFGFCALCWSQLFMLNGDVTLLSGVYTFSFLGVMLFFSLGCLLLKYKRPSLPREVNSSYLAIISGMTLVLIAYMGNVLSKAEVLPYFSLYCLGVGAFVLSMFMRVRVLRGLVSVISNMFPGSKSVHELREHINDLQNTPFLFFCKYDDLYVINKAVLYVKENEQTQRLLVVHCCDDPEASAPVIKKLSEHIEMFDHIYPRIKISLLTIKGQFCPSLINWLSTELSVPKNMFFITCIDSVFKYKIQHLGGEDVVRQGVLSC